ncbi:MAG TPA: TlpA disulfide reductase family protein [Mucilaginibacter sp.]|nr:TlpA disulfide reductase family protein [Mucilaginibacter sp.]
MKKIVLLMLAGIPAIVFAQEGKYAVKGTIGNLNAPAKIYLRYRDAGKVVTDSTVLKDGKFEFDGKAAAAPSMAYLMLNQKGTGPGYDDYKAIYLENGTIDVNSPDTLKSAKVGGTKTNIENGEYEQAFKPVEAAYMALEAKSKAASDEEKQSEAFKKESDKAEKAIEAQESALNKKFIQEHPDSYISLNILPSYAYSADYSDIEPLFSGLAPAIKESEAGKKFAELLPKMKAVSMGSIAPEFTEADTSGKMVSLSSFRGKYVLIDFWASWCGPCRMENPNVVKAYNRFKNQKFTIVGVSLDQPNGKQKWLDAIHKDGLYWTQVSDLKFWNSKTAGMYAVRAIPQNFLLDPDGKIIGKNLRGDDLENKLEEIFGKI